MLVPTNRDWYRIVSAGTIVDFENAVGTIAAADLLSLPPSTRRARALALASGRRIAPVEVPGGPYDLCLYVAFELNDVRGLRYVRNLERHCGKLAVYVFDAWSQDTSAFRAHRRLWRECDHLFVSFPEAARAYAEHVDCPVTYLPQAIAPERFHPFRDERPVDVLSLGRRLPAVHEALRAIARGHDLWYHFSEARSPEAIDLEDSQLLVGRLCQSARIQVSWPLEVTHADDARARYSEAADGSPITVRWFEAAACGSVALGRRPRTTEFERLFPYDGFVREVDPGRPETLEQVVLDALRSSTDREERLRLADHVRLEHSWQARVAAILAAVL